MQPETEFGKFNNLIRGMARMYGQDVDAAFLDAYWLALKGWDYADLSAAAGVLMGTATFMPRPSDFNALRKAGEPTSGEAWCKVLDVVRSCWPGQQMTVDDRTDRVVRAMGGFRALALTNADEMHFRAKRFAELWEEFGGVDETRKALPFVSTGRAVGGPTKLFGAIAPRDTFADPPDLGRAIER
jgi:hypothetical protein